MYAFCKWMKDYNHFHNVKLYVCPPLRHAPGKGFSSVRYIGVRSPAHIINHTVKNGVFQNTLGHYALLIIKSNLSITRRA